MLNLPTSQKPSLSAAWLPLFTPLAGTDDSVVRKDLRLNSQLWHLLKKIAGIGPQGCFSLAAGVPQRCPPKEQLEMAGKQPPKMERFESDNQLYK